MVVVRVLWCLIHQETFLISVDASHSIAAFMVVSVAR